MKEGPHAGCWMPRDGDTSALFAETVRTMSQQQLMRSQAHLQAQGALLLNNLHVRGGAGARCAGARLEVQSRLLPCRAPPHPPPGAASALTLPSLGLP